MSRAMIAMIVLSLISIIIFCGWHTYLVVERRAMLDRIYNNGGVYATGSFDIMRERRYVITVSARTLIGDKRVLDIHLPESMSSDSSSVQQLFPEAEVGVLIETESHGELTNQSGGVAGVLP